jgi:hypothetical protein
VALEKAFDFAMQQVHENKLDKDDLQHLTKKEIFLPKSVHEIEMVLATYEAILATLTSTNSILTRFIHW